MWLLANTTGGGKMAEGYRLPEEISDMTVHFMYGLSGKTGHTSVEDYLAESKFALAADLLAEGFKPSDIEAAVNSGSIGYANWPAKEPKTALYWNKGADTTSELEGMASQACALCYGRTQYEPVGGNFASVGAEMGSQQLALAALIYAREKGLVREIAELDNGCGPMYIARGTFSDRMFSMFMPEKRA
jgi:hypothetical protein